MKCWHTKPIPEALSEELLTGQLSRNKLTSEGISTVRPSGGQ